MEENQTNNSIRLTEKLIHALNFSALAHDGQFRKDEQKTPYFAHPAGVGLILTQLGCEEDVVIAGILHDVIEDTKYTFADIVQKFGQNIAEIVQWVSQPEGLDYDATKEAYLQNLAKSPNEARLVSGADMLFNRADILQSYNTDPQNFDKHKFRSYIIPERQERRINIIAEGLGEEHPLVQRLREQHQVFLSLFQ